MSNELAYLQSLPSALIAADSALNVTFINPAAESLFKVSGAQALGEPMAKIPGFTEALCDMCERVLSSQEAVTLFEQLLPVPFAHRTVTLHVTPSAGGLLITIEHFDGLDQLAVSQWKRDVSQAAGLMAAMLAHEVKNPLAGIRGAAQLLKEDAPPDQKPLADLICMEADRISDLLARMEIFSAAPSETQPVNIHEVLQYVITIAQAGFAQHAVFQERYDPSLPPVAGHRDLLVQLFLNLIKNSAEAMEGQKDATITITTAWKPGYVLRLNAEERVALPVAVTIEDNGPGVPEAIRSRLFEPFVSSKEEGRGLGLAIAAKIAADLNLAIELDQEFRGGTRFTVWLGTAP